MKFYVLTMFYGDSEKIEIVELNKKSMSACWETIEEEIATSFSQSWVFSKKGLSNLRKQLSEVKI